MKIEVLEEKENLLLNRREIVAKIVHDDSTPSREDVRGKAMAKLKGKKDTFILDSIKTRFGARESIANIRIYNSKDRVLEIEPEHVLKKNLLIIGEAEEKPVKKEVAEEKPAKEEKAEEKPAKEENPEAVEKEESKAEEKPKKREKPAVEAKEVEEPKAEKKPEEKKTAKAEKSKETSAKKEKNAKEE